MEGNGAYRQTQRRADADGSKTQFAAGAYRIAEHVAQIADVFNRGQHADLIADFQS